MLVRKLQHHLLAIVVLCVIPTMLGFRFPSRKMWWTKQLTDQLHVAGRLTETQVKYARDDGFRSLVSIINMTSRDALGPASTDPLPSTAEMEALATSIGLTYVNLGALEDDWHERQYLQRFSDVFGNLRKPVLFHDVNGAYAASFLGLAYYLNVSRHDPSDPEGIDMMELFRRSARLGYPHYDDVILRNVATQISGVEVLKENLPRPTVTLQNWYTGPYSWMMKPVYKNIFVAGQIQVNHLDGLKSLGVGTIVNLRRGTVNALTGVPSQEEAVLLNVRDRTGTYYNTTYHAPYRQTRKQLEKNRLDASLPNTYISPDSNWNYQKSNSLQFGDHIGYNESISRLEIIKRGFNYSHTPVGGAYKYGLRLWQAHSEQWLADDLTGDQPVLLQCRTGYRTTVAAMLIVGCLYNKNSSWVLHLAADMGYHFEADRELAVVQMVRDVVDNADEQCRRPEPVTTPSSAAHRQVSNVIAVFAIIVTSLLFGV